MLPTTVRGPITAGNDARTRKHDLLACATEAEQNGFAGLWAMDHLLPLRHPVYNGLSWLDPIVTLSAVATHTENVKLGAIFSACLRHPVVAAKQLASLMFLAPGRVILGVTIGYGGGEHEAAGFPKAERGRRTDEWLAAVRLLLTTEGASFSGEFWQFDEVTVDPLPDELPQVWVAAAAPYVEKDAVQDRASIKPGPIDRVLGSDGWIVAASSSTTKVAADWQRIVDRAGEVGRDPSMLTISHGNYMHLVETASREEAYRVQRPLWNSTRTIGGEFEEMSEKCYLTGTIDDVHEKLADRAHAGISELILCSWDGHAREQLGLWSKHVLPVAATL